jgi:hypothetical protein
MPIPKQMEILAAAVGRNDAAPLSLGPSDEMPPEYWQAVLNDPCLDARPSPGLIQAHPLNEIAQNVLRVSCNRCGRIIEIQKADAARIYGPQAIWKDVALRLLDNTCRTRTGRYEEDGCWPAFE